MSLTIINDDTALDISPMDSLLDYNSEMLEKTKPDEEYYKNFYRQFSLAEKKMYNDIDTFETLVSKDVDLYKEWCEKRHLLLIKYCEFLRRCNLHPNKYKCIPSIELFKGAYDSIRSLESKIIVYSKYAGTLGDYGKKSGIHLFDIAVRNGVPGYLIRTKSTKVNLIEAELDYFEEPTSIEEGKPIFVPFNTSYYDRYYVHNPMDPVEKSRCERLAANPELNVIYGLFGLEKEEENLNKKIEDLEKLKKEIPGAKFFEERMETSKIGEYHIGILYAPKTKSLKNRQN